MCRPGKLPPIEKRLPQPPLVVQRRQPRQARRHAAQPGRPQPRHAAAGGLRLRAPGRLRPRFQPRARHPGELSRRRKGGSSRSSCARAIAGPTAIRSPPRISATTGRTWRTTRSSRPPARRRTCWSTAQPPKFEVLVRDRGALHLAQAQPAFPAAPGRRFAALHLPAGALPEAATQEILGEGAQERRPTARRSASGRRCTTAPTTCYESDNPDLPTLQPWMNTTKPPADRFVAVRNPYFHRVDAAGPAAALHRPRHPRGRRSEADPGQDRRRRGRPAGARRALQQLHLPQAGREAERLPHAALAAGEGLAFRAVSRT